MPKVLRGHRGKVRQRDWTVDDEQSLAESHVDNSSVVGSKSVKGGGMFSKLDIDIETLTKSLSEGDVETRSAVTSKTLKNLNLKKDEKQRLKHSIWMRRVDILKDAKKARAAKTKREKTPIVGDLKPIQDALPTLDLLMRDHQVKQERPLPKARSIKKLKTQRKEMFEDVKLFGKLLEEKHKEFKSRPRKRHHNVPTKTLQDEKKHKVPKIGVKSGIKKRKKANKRRENTKK